MALIREDSRLMALHRDLDFLRRFPQNAEPLHELQLAAQKFVNTYVYIRGFNSHTVEKIQHMYDKTCKVFMRIVVSLHSI